MPMSISGTRMRRTEQLGSNGQHLGNDPSWAACRTNTLQVVVLGTLQRPFLQSVWTSRPSARNLSATSFEVSNSRFESSGC